jgi:ferredoxin-NADP reductase
MTEYNSVVKDKIFLTPNTVELVVEVSGDFTFIPGQFVQFLIEDKVFRAYSMISLPSELPVVRFLIHLEEGGVGSEFVRAKAVGESIAFRGPVGNFIWKEKFKTTIFVATGVGLAPFISMIQDGLTEASQAILLFGNREPEQIFYKQFF